MWSRGSASEPDRNSGAARDARGLTGDEWRATTVRKWGAGSSSYPMDPFVVADPFPFAQQKFLNFPRAGLGQRGHEFNGRGTLETSQVLAAKGNQLPRLDMRIFFEHD